MIQLSHPFFLRRCLELAEQGRGKTGTNPMVGAVLVRDGKILAEAFHSEFGKAHAERQLLQNFDPTSPLRLRGASQKISSKDILYVNLEPCCHTHKKTPPCTDIFLEKGIKHVVYGMKDPNPKVSGNGIAYLIKKGVQVLGPVLEDECMRLNRGFVSLMKNGRPWITLKSAHAADGSIANFDGSPKRITSNQQDEWSHRFLRARHDAILLGVGTVITDDPELTVRCGDCRPPLWRIILDPHLKIPLSAKVLGSRTIVVTLPGSDAKKIKKTGTRVLEVPVRGETFDWEKLWKGLTTADGDFHGISSILVEGGVRTWEAFRQAGVVDEEVTLSGS